MSILLRKTLLFFCFGFASSKLHFEDGDHEVFQNMELSERTKFSREKKENFNFKYESYLLIPTKDLVGPFWFLGPLNFLKGLA